VSRDEDVGKGVALAGVALGAWCAWRMIRRAGVAKRSLRGQVALVTGGSRGLGFLIARELVREGCRVVICARDATELERARRDLSADGAQILAIPCDVTEPSQVERLVWETAGRFGPIDLLVNNAGIIQVGPVESLALADFQQTMSVNFWGTVHTTLAVLPQMRSRRSGRIVNITSIGGKVAVPRLLPYDAAKFAAVGFSEGLRAEVAKDGVSVTTIVPGLMRTGSFRFAHFKSEGDSRWFSVAARAPGLTIGARRAARMIVEAAKRRDAEPVLGVPAKLLRLVKELFPSMTSSALAIANRVLPNQH
jgi:short-subunit dehydrogenase